MLSSSTFLVTPKTKLLSSKHSFEIRDQNGNIVGNAEQKTGLLDALLGAVLGPPATKIEVKQKSDGAPVFTVRRRGVLMKKVECVDEKGEVVGRFKGKSFSLSGGYHVYDKDGKHIAEIRGKFFKAEFTVFAPDGKTEMGKVSRKWGGAMKELLSSDKTYGVKISDAFANEQQTKIMILGAAIALDSLLKKEGVAGKAEGGGEEGGEE
jgi:uncharacterized protein YxjI